MGARQSCRLPGAQPFPRRLETRIGFGIAAQLGRKVKLMVQPLYRVVRIAQVAALILVVRIQSSARNVMRATERFRRQWYSLPSFIMAIASGRISLLGSA
jgi:hypothetical protein